MGRLHYKESSSEELDENEEKGEEEEEEEEEKKPEKEEVQKKERTISGGEVQDEEIKFGVQLQDDLINSFCDKLQAVCPRKLEALLAIQFLLITDMAEVRKHVTGKNPAMQVLYDRTRSHYVLVCYNPKHQHVEVYDSLQPYEQNGGPQIIREITTQLSHLFGHLHTKYIPIVVDREFETQSDNFSCGYRVIGALVDLACERNPAAFKYSRTSILELLRAVLNEPKPTWQMFQSAKLGKPKQYSGYYRVKLHIPNLTYISSSTSSSQSRSRSSSVDSQVSKTSQNSQSSRKSSRRSDAGSFEYYAREEEEEEEDEREFDFAKIPFRFYNPEVHALPPKAPTIGEEHTQEGPFMGILKYGSQFFNGFFRRRPDEYKKEEEKE